MAYDSLACQLLSMLPARQLYTPTSVGSGLRIEAEIDDKPYL